MVPLVVLMIVLGLYPKILLDRTAASTEALLDRVEQASTYEVPEPGRLADVFASIPEGDE